MITVEVTQESQAALRIRLDSAREGVRKGVKSGIRASIIYVGSYIKRELLSGQILKNRSGNLRRAVFTEMVDDETGRVAVGPEAPYGRFLNDGARPHMIYPKNGKALAFTPNAAAIRASIFTPKGKLGATLAANRIVVRGVHHPGNPPYRFMQLGLISSASEIRNIISHHVNVGLKGQPSE